MRLLVLVLGACTPVLRAPVRADCTNETTIDRGGDGTIDATVTSTWDGEGRRVHQVVEDSSAWSSEESVTFDAAGCRSAEDYAAVHVNGDTYTRTSALECDRNNDPVDQVETFLLTGSTPTDLTYQRSWARTYGPNGLTATIYFQEFAGTQDSSSSHTLTWDDRDRLVTEQIEVGEEMTVRRFTWFEGLRADDLLAVYEETVDGEPVLRRENTFDERGRVIERREDLAGVVTLTTTGWVPRRWAETSIEVVVDGVPTLASTVETSDERPFLQRRVESDGFAGPYDGEVDFVQTETWTCP